MKKSILALLVFCFCLITIHLPAQTFVHPGIDQSAADLALMKKKVLAGEEPYKSAFDKIKAAADTSFRYKPYAHVLRGPYGKPNIGGDDLSRSANMAYNYALVWYITNNKSYAQKAIDILNAWSPALWHFDYNDAKLLAAWTGHILCNAAEILRYTNAGWQPADQENFKNMLMTVYYPLMRYYYPQANGNWDGAIIHSILAIAIYTDNRPMFNNAIDHFLHGPVNGSIFKYIYPSGQCQETPRDQGHVQLGLGEFAGAAQIAFTQGVDLFRLADNRIGLGYEYTASFILGEEPQSYGIKSERAKTLRDDYEYVYRHYAGQGVSLPFTKRAADSVRQRPGRSVLTSIRVNYGKQQNSGVPKPSAIGYVAGAGAATTVKVPSNAIEVASGESLQKALDNAAGSGRWVLAKAGVHKLPGTLRMPSGVTLAGEGLNTILFLDPASGEREAIVNATDDMHDVTIRDLVIECGTRTETPSDPNSIRSYRGGYNRGGILFRTENNGQMKNVSLANLTVRNGTYNGVFLNGITNVAVSSCDFSENGVSVPPGAKLLHNLLVTHCDKVSIKDSRLVTSPYGAGIAIDKSSSVSVTNCEIARNGYYGILVSESKDINISKNLVEGNDLTGLMVEFLRNGSQKVAITNNRIQFNNGYGVETYAATQSIISNNRYEGNGLKAEQQKISDSKTILME